MSRVHDELLAFLEEFIKFDPHEKTRDGYTMCRYCLEDNRIPLEGIAHDAHCLWKRAEDLLREIVSGKWED